MGWNISRINSDLICEQQQDYRDAIIRASSGGFRGILYRTIACYIRASIIYTDDKNMFSQRERERGREKGEKDVCT